MGSRHSRPAAAMPPDPADIRTYVINLRRRTDRRDQITQILPPELAVTFTSNWGRPDCDPFDGHQLDLAQLTATGYRLFSWQDLSSENPWWNRPLKLGEIGCALAHLACWRHAAHTGAEPFVLILEDDAVLPAGFLDRLLTHLAELAATPFDLLYLGRYPLAPDRPVQAGVVSPGYSHCTFGYLLTRPALATALGAGLEQALVPIDEFLPALYTTHPRPDLRARFPRRLTALACEPPLISQRPKAEAGSDTEDSPFTSPANSTAGPSLTDQRAPDGAASAQSTAATGGLPTPEPGSRH